MMVLAREYFKITKQENILVRGTQKLPDLVFRRGRRGGHLFHLYRQLKQKQKQKIKKINLKLHFHDYETKNSKLYS
jgi:hypothetical protein